ncbi:MAG: H-NS histone family protein [Limnohabitans sp.]|nr:H-NS histone family protein [Limnohabitans sp.]
MATSVASQLAKLRKEREALEKREKALMARTHDKALSKIVQIARDAGLSAEDIAKALGQGKATKKPARAAGKSTGSRGKVAPKYRNPAQADQTWTGRGKAPVWVQALKAAGTLETALIK